ncbi:MAG: chitinase, partial [Anaerolineae bacterium]
MKRRSAGLLFAVLALSIGVLACGPSVAPDQPTEPPTSAPPTEIPTDKPATQIPPTQPPPTQSPPTQPPPTQAPPPTQISGDQLDYGVSDGEVTFGT